MSKIPKLQIILLFLLTSLGNAQDYFEGQIEYKVEYESLNSNLPLSYLENEFGKSFSAYIQEDRYAMIYHAKGQLGWMKIMVMLNDGYTYTEFEKSDTITRTKFGSSQQKLVEFKRNSDNKKEVLGELCESINIEYTPTDSKAFFQAFRGTYYFNPKYKLNEKLYQGYTDGFWNMFVHESQSISIRNETEYYPIFKSVQEAISIIEKEIPDNMFIIDESKVVSDK